MKQQQTDVKSTDKNTKTTSWFRTAAPYIHTHRNATFVISFDGETVACSGFDNLIHDLALLNSLGIRLVLVFGARPQIEQQCQIQDVAIQYHQGLRVSDENSMKIAKSVIGKLRIEIEAKLSFGLPNTPMAGSQICCVSGNLVTAQPVGIRDGIDFGNTGEVRKIDAQAIRDQLSQGNTVLLPPLGYSPTGEIFNLSAEAIATSAATALAADKLIFIGGPTTDLPHEMTTAQAKTNLHKNDGNSVLQSAIQACESGVNRVHLLDRQSDGALLQELFSRDGAGILITANTFETIRQASIEDVGGILELIKPLENNGTLVKRSREHLEIEVDHFTVMERDGVVIACASIYAYPENAIGELACLAVAQDYQKSGRGKQLLLAIEQQAKMYKLNRLCILTTQTAHWFLEHGFKPAEIADLPVSKQSLYNYQRNSKVLSKNLV